MKIVLSMKPWCKILAIVLSSFVIIEAFNGFFYFLNSDTLFYIKQNPEKIVSERRKITPLYGESSTQALVRVYVEGPSYYNMKKPFSLETRVVSSAIDSKNQVIVINMNGYFLIDSSNSYFNQDLELLLRTLKENTQLKKVFFLIEGYSNSILWNGIDISQGVSLNVLNKKN